MWDKLRHIDRDDVLDYIGLQAKRGPVDWLVPALSAFGVGILVGAGAGLLLAPKPGVQLREDLKQKLQAGSLLANGAMAQAKQTLSERPSNSGY